MSSIVNVPTTEDKPSSEILNLFSIMQDNKDLFYRLSNGYGVIIPLLY